MITSANQGSITYRNSPDVAANSDFTYYLCANQTTCTANQYGGTSFAAPLWAAFIALANQQAIANSGKTLGFINPLIYPLGLSSGYSAAFHEITSGSNGYPAVAGYNLATGWGSMNGEGLINALVGSAASPAAAADFSVGATPAAITVPRRSSGNSPIVTMALNGFNSAIALSATSVPKNVSGELQPRIHRRARLGHIDDDDDGGFGRQARNLHHHRNRHERRRYTYDDLHAHCPEIGLQIRVTQSRRTIS